MKALDLLIYKLALAWLFIPAIVLLMAMLADFEPGKLKQRVIAYWKVDASSRLALFCRRALLAILWPSLLFPIIFPGYGLLVGIILFSFIGCQPPIEIPKPTEAQAMKGNQYISELEKQGRNLRREIDSQYYGWMFSRQRSLNLDNVFRKYIPIGTPFDDAEYILRSAGFSLSERWMNGSKKKNEIPQDRHSEYVHGSIDGYSKWRIGVEVFVHLKPMHPFDYSEVREVTGSIHTTAL